MSEDMSFLPKKDVLSLEELERLCSVFIKLGVKKLRLTGGEPLVRKNIMSLIQALGKRLDSGDLEELTLTTNGTQLHKYSKDLFDYGVRRVNVSIDTLDPEKFTEITRWGKLENVLRGIEAADNAGLKLKLNVVALRGTNDEELPDIVKWASDKGYDITIIEVMPMGDIGSENRINQYLPLSMVRSNLSKYFTLRDIDYKTGGPARYVEIVETGTKIGFITPLTHNFCESCNRVRLTCTGTLYMCLGQEDAADLKIPLRNSEGDGALTSAIQEAISRKPKGHDFIIDRRQKSSPVPRHMSVTGG
jgi:cyclic pyranopterin phosphate synthase|tara:strand:- start:2753 stop:3664 length:912 start_codon:yes stop_codon:yes gene_type:complete